MNRITKKQAYQVGFLPEGDQIRLFKLCLSRVIGDKKFLKHASLMTDRILRPNLKYESWMERRFEANHKITPRRVAFECRLYMKIDKRKASFLRELARKVKKRVLMRKRNQSKREEADRIEGLPFELWEEYFTDLKKEFENSRIHLFKRYRRELDSGIKLIDWMKQRLAEAPTLTTLMSQKSFGLIVAPFYFFLVKSFRECLKSLYQSPPHFRGRKPSPHHP